MELANQSFIRAIQADPTDSQSLYKYGHFLARCSQFESAVEFHLRALEENPNHISCLISLEHLLTRLGKQELVNKIKARFVKLCDHRVR